MPLKGSVGNRIKEFHKGGTYAHIAHKFGKERADAQAITVVIISKKKKGKKKRGSY